MLVVQMERFRAVVATINFCRARELLSSSELASSFSSYCYLGIIQLKLECSGASARRQTGARTMEDAQPLDRSVLTAVGWLVGRVGESQRVL